MTRRTSDLRVLYVTDNRHGHDAWHDPSARHRCYHYADALNASASGTADVVNVRRINRKLLARYDHVVFHRPKKSRRFCEALRLCEHSDAILHADYDDLIFEPELAEYSPLFINGNRPISAVKQYFIDNMEALLCFDSFLVSTRMLASRLQSISPDASITVLPNSLPRLFRQPRLNDRDEGVFTIGYFPGSNSHTHDFDSVREALALTLEKYRCCRLMIAGQLSLDKATESMAQVIKIPFSGYNKYLELLRNVDVSMAPLESNVFNDCKSAVKLIESCAVGTPLIATHNDDMQDHTNALSYLVKEPDQWGYALEEVVCGELITAPVETVAQQAAVEFGVQSRLPVLERHLCRSRSPLVASAGFQYV